MALTIFQVQNNLSLANFLFFVNAKTISPFQFLIYKYNFKTYYTSNYNFKSVFQICWNVREYKKFIINENTVFLKNSNRSCSEILMLQYLDQSVQTKMICWCEALIYQENKDIFEMLYGSAIQKIICSTKTENNPFTIIQNWITAEIGKQFETVFGFTNFLSFLTWVNFQRRTRFIITHNLEKFFFITFATSMYFNDTKI